MNDKFTEDFIKEQLGVMEKFEKANCSPSPEYLAGRNAAIQNYADALRKISSLEYEIRSWCRDMSTICEQANIMLNQRDEIEEGLNKRIAELEAENIRLGIEYQRMRLALGDIAINSKRALNESPTDQLTADSTDERQDDKWIPVRHGGCIAARMRMWFTSGRRRCRNEYR